MSTPADQKQVPPFKHLKKSSSENLVLTFKSEETTQEPLFLGGDKNLKPSLKTIAFKQLQLKKNPQKTNLNAKLKRFNSSSFVTEAAGASGDGFPDFGPGLRTGDAGAEDHGRHHRGGLRRGDEWLERAGRLGLAEQEENSKQIIKEKKKKKYYKNSKKTMKNSPAKQSCKTKNQQTLVQKQFIKSFAFFKLLGVSESSWFLNPRSLNK